MRARFFDAKSGVEPSGPIQLTERGKRVVAGAFVVSGIALCAVGVKVVDVVGGAIGDALEGAREATAANRLLELVTRPDILDAYRSGELTQEQMSKLTVVIADERMSPWDLAEGIKDPAYGRMAGVAGAIAVQADAQGYPGVEPGEWIILPSEALLPEAQE